MRLLKKGEYVRTENEKELDAVLKLHYDAGITFTKGELDAKWLKDNGYGLILHYGYNQYLNKKGLFVREDAYIVPDYKERPISDFLKPEKMLFWNSNVKKELYLCGVVKGAEYPFLAVYIDDEKKYLDGEEFNFSAWKHCERIPERNILKEATDVLKEHLKNVTITEENGTVTLKAK